MTDKKRVEIKNGYHSGIPADNVIDLRLPDKKNKNKNNNNDRAAFWGEMLKEISKKRENKKIIKAREKLEKKSEKNLIKNYRVDQIKPEKKLNNFQFNRIYFKNVLIFIIIAVILVLPFYAFIYYKKVLNIKGEVVAYADQAYSNLLEVENDVNNFNINDANQHLGLAVDNFTSAQNKLNNISSLMINIARVYPPGYKQLKTAKGLLEAGKQITLAGQQIASTALALENFNSQDDEVGFTTPLYLSQDYLKNAAKNLEASQASLADVELEYVPAEQREKISLLIETLPSANKSFGEFSGLISGLLEILGHYKTQRYLLLFQNNAEIRPTGGFIGSLALVDIRKGKVKNIEIAKGGPYDYAGQQIKKVVSPEPLHLVNPAWQIQDANWWLDFPASARKTVWFFTNSGGPSVDGVITFTPAIIEDLLEITGPIDMTQKYGVIIDQNNFVDFAQAEVEKSHDNNPKQFIADLAPELLNKLLSGDLNNYFNILKVLSAGLSEKNILLYFSDDDLENQMKELGWAGEIKNAEKDYLAVVNTNIGGGKTDNVIDQFVEHRSEIQDDGSIIDTVKVTRTHKGPKSDVFKGVKNIDYIRFYAPEGSKLLETSNFSNIWKNLFIDPDPSFARDADLSFYEQGMVVDAETNTRINNEFNKTVFGNWVATEAGQTSVVIIKYLLPFKIDLKNGQKDFDSYSLLVQKQPGMADYPFASKVSWPENVIATKTFPSDSSIELNKNSLNYKTTMDFDRYYGVVFKKTN